MVKYTHQMKREITKKILSTFLEENVPVIVGRKATDEERLTFENKFYRMYETFDEQLFSCMKGAVRFAVETRRPSHFIINDDELNYLFNLVVNKGDSNERSRGLQLTLEKSIMDTKSRKRKYSRESSPSAASNVPVKEKIWLTTWLLETYLEEGIIAPLTRFSSYDEQKYFQVKFFEKNESTIMACLINLSHSLNLQLGNPPQYVRDDTVLNNLYRKVVEKGLQHRYSNQETVVITEPTNKKGPINVFDTVKNEIDNGSYDLLAKSTTISNEIDIEQSDWQTATTKMQKTIEACDRQMKYINEQEKELKIGKMKLEESKHKMKKLHQILEKNLNEKESYIKQHCMEKRSN